MSNFAFLAAEFPAVHEAAVEAERQAGVSSTAAAFFAGKVYTPDWMIDGVNVQDYLQEHYCGALAAIAQRVKDLPNVVGFDTLNEPGMGWIAQTGSAEGTTKTF